MEEKRMASEKRKISSPSSPYPPGLRQRFEAIVVLLFLRPMFRSLFTEVLGASWAARCTIKTVASTFAWDSRANLSKTFFYAHLTTAVFDPLRLRNELSKVWMSRPHCSQASRRKAAAQPEGAKADCSAIRGFAHAPIKKHGSRTSLACTAEM